LGSVVLLIHRSERADALVTALGQLLNTPSDDPFRPEIVAVPSRGVERWLAQQFSHVLGAVNDDGVCANVLFPSYTHVLDEAVAEADEGYAAAVEAWDPDRSVWPLLRVVDTCAPEPWCRVLATHLGLDGSGDKGRRYAVASKLAWLFERYARSRPEMINVWQMGRDEQGDGNALPDDLTWQGELWRRLREQIGAPSPAELLEQACERIGPGPSFSIFGATRISPARIKVLGALARERNIHLWLHHPSPALWTAVNEVGDAPGRRRDQQPVVAHPLLASMSRDVRELQQLLRQTAADDQHHPIEARPSTLLGRLQDELAHDRVPNERMEVTDRSLQVHAAHGPARQVEILREAILGLLAADPTLEPRDILIMCPDVETFAPLIAASFGMVDEPGAHPAGKLRVKLADRSLRQTNPLLGLLSQLLELATSRVTATQMLDLAGAVPVRRRFGFDEDDLERLRDWTAKAGARWGLDAEHRAAYQLSGIAQGTWRSAIDRLLLGVAMEEGVAWVGDTLPLDDVDSADIDLAGRFAEFVDRVDQAVRGLSATRTMPAWARLIDELVRSLGEGDHTWQEMQLRRELDELAESATNVDVDLALPDVTALLRGRLAGRPTRASFRTGTLTVCTLVPMRSVPHRVICLLGMDDGTFPRQGVADGDDVLAREPRSGERDVRSEDRQLFLDAICAAREHLVITYTGANPRTGAEMPPCVPLSELLDAIDATAVAPGGGRAREAVVVHHPLQPFDPRNFTPNVLGGNGPFSFDPTGFMGASATAKPRVPAAPLVARPLSEAPHEDVIGLNDLVRFFQHPVRGFLRQRLDIATFSGEEDPADALTVALDPLQGWTVGDRVLQHCLSGTPPRVAATLEYVRGELPPGALGQRAMQQIGPRVDALLHASEIERQAAAESLDVTVDLGGGRTLTGTVGGVRGDVILTVTYSTLGPKHRLAAWLRYLAVTASTGNQGLRAVTVGRKNNDARRSILHGVAPDVARRCLDMLVAVRDAGLREPLPIALESSAEYAGRRQRGTPVADSMAAARQRWEPERYAERDEPEHVLVYGPKAPFGRLTEQPAEGDERYPGEATRFGGLARLIWAPLLTAETDVWP